jgi:hypothetical protein
MRHCNIGKINRLTRAESFMQSVYDVTGSHDGDASGPRQEFMLTFLADRLVFRHSPQGVLNDHAIFIFNAGSLELAMASRAGDDLCHRQPPDAQQPTPKTVV